ncbi:MAG: hypothetical protein EBZ69_04375 [Alphaproteobacteria bacterium]|nr:hypothetical protein [Alphaproteobacteria bacterium]NDC56034.1 hypothetical protein [Alphaproteobacteria bacterium]NDG04238.1 hypothetical protein [Alphaproteobacteria bacterium]
MQDHGEKIVSLAREMLSQADPSPRAASEWGWKGLALAALLGAASAGAGYLTGELYRPLNRNELIELQALIHYAAKMHRVPSERIGEDLYGYFNISALNELNFGMMEETRNYLYRKIKAPEQ